MPDDMGETIYAPISRPWPTRAARLLVARPFGVSGRLGDVVLQEDAGRFYVRLGDWYVSRGYLCTTRDGIGAPPNTLTIGAVETLIAGSTAAASITGTPPNQVLHLGIPRGPGGSAGPPNTLAMGTVTTGAAGSAAATITGTAPNQTLNLTIPQGATGPSGAVLLGTITLGQTAAIAIALGPRQITVLNVTGVLAGDRILLTPTAVLPAGFMLGDCVSSANGSVTVTVYAPLLSLGQSYSITAKVTVFR